MGLDIRLPIGLMFGILGVLLAAFGLFGDKSIYERSLGININLIWGTILIVFSLILLWLGSRKGRRN
jgi:multisubunit Na+/H+ antiporter MnhG subunit